MAAVPEPTAADELAAIALARSILEDDLPAVRALMPTNVTEARRVIIALAVTVNYTLMSMAKQATGLPGSAPELRAIALSALRRMTAEAVSNPESVWPFYEQS